MIIRLTSAVIVGGIHRNAGEEVKVDSALGDSLVRRQLAEPITPASKPTQASSPAPQPTLDLDPPAPPASPDSPAPAPTSDPVINDETDETEREQETEPSDTVEPRETETESPGEPATVPEGETSSSPSRKRRRR